MAAQHRGYAQDPQVGSPTKKNKKNTSNPIRPLPSSKAHVKHVYFFAETKGSLSSMDLRKIAESKIACASKFFLNHSDQVKYDAVDGYRQLMALVA